MDYKRIDKVQIGVISPSKLRMKLLGAQHIKRKQGECSSRPTPSKFEGTEYAKRNLLAGNFYCEAGSKDSTIASINPKLLKTEFSSKELSGYGEGYQNQSSIGNSLYKEISDTKYTRNQKNSSNSSYQVKIGNNFCTVQPMRHQDEDGNDCGSGHESASTSNFEFHGGRKISQHQVIGPFSRHIPSKWNDAEKWLVNRQAVQENGLKKSSVQYQCNQLMDSSWVRIAPESMITDQKPSVIQPAASNPNSQNMAEKCQFVSQGMHANSFSSNDTRCLTDTSQACQDFVCLARLPEDLNHRKSSVSESFTSGTTDIPTEQTVSMKDVGTEMTPIPSQEPSRTGTPIEHLTPSRSPISSILSSPGRKSGAVNMTPPTKSNDKKDVQKDGRNMELSERELQLKTRQEIAALGLQLGKLNIASWATQEADPKSLTSITIDEDEQLKLEYEARAAAWEEAEKFKHMAGYKREEIKIQSWKSHQSAKYEARMRKIEIRAVNMRSRAEANLVEKLRTTEQRVEEKRANAEAKMNLQAARTSQQAEHIRQSGRVPSHVRCCSWFL